MRLGRRAVLSGIAGSLPFGLAGCGSAPTTYYALAAVPGRPVWGGPAVVEIRRPGLAGYLDRSDIVKGQANYRLDVASTESWGEPLGDMIGRVLAQDLAQRLPGSSVFTEQGAISANPGARVEIDIDRFDASESTDVTLVAQVAIEAGRSHAALLTRNLRLSAHPGGPGTPFLVAAMSALLGALADQIALMLHALPPAA